MVMDDNVSVRRLLYGTILLINLLGIVLTPRICMGDWVFLWWASDELFFARLTTDIIKVDLADRVLALASKRCFLCSALYSQGVVEKKRPFLASFRLEANVKLASFLNPKWWCWNDHRSLKHLIISKWMLRAVNPLSLQILRIDRWRHNAQLMT